MTQRESLSAFEARQGISRGGQVSSPGGLLELPDVAPRRPGSEETTSSALRGLRSRLGSRLGSSASRSTPASMGRRFQEGSLALSGDSHFPMRPPDSPLSADDPGYSSLSSFRSIQSRMSSPPSRMPSPPLYHSPKAEVFFKDSAERQVLSDCGIVTDPPGSSMHKRMTTANPYENEEPEKKGDKGVPPKLPLEGFTEEVLEKIFPISPDGENRHSVSAGSCSPSSPSSPNCRKSLRKSQSFLERTASKMPERQADANSELMLFRSKVLQKLCTLIGTFEAFGRKNGCFRSQVPHKKFIQFMDEHFKRHDKSQQQAMFEFLDAGGTGGVSVLEFRIACEAVLEVKSIEDMRNKLIALGFPTMLHVVSLMEITTRRSWERVSFDKRLHFDEFAAALWKVGIETKEGQRNIFAQLSNGALDPTVSLGELTVALGAVGPPLVLEAIRARMLELYGDLNSAYDELDVDGNGELACEELEYWVMHKLKMPKSEAKKAFRFIDIDGSGSISRVELLGALRLVEPNLLLERARKRVRQRWRSIQEAFDLHTKAYETFDPVIMQRYRGSRIESPSGCASEIDGKTMEDFQYILKKVSLVDYDTSMLFKRIDIDNDGTLTSLEFANGMRVFAPSCILEELRLRCMVKYHSVSQAFDGLSEERRSAVLHVEEFQDALEELDLATGVNGQLVYDLVERRQGGLLINELIIALHAAAPGVLVPLPPEQRDAKAIQKVKDHMDPFMNICEEHRWDCREQMIIEKPKEPTPMGHSSVPGSYLGTSVAWENDWGMKRRVGAEKKKLKSSMSAPALPVAFFNPLKPEASLPQYRRFQRPPEPPQWSVNDRSRVMGLLRNVSPDLCKDPGSYDPKDGVDEYWTDANKRLANDKDTLELDFVSPLQQWHDLQAAVHS